MRLNHEPLKRIARRQRTLRSEQHRARFKKGSYNHCKKCDGPVATGSASQLCHDCYWIERRANSPHTEKLRSEYDASRYDQRRRRESFLQKKYGISLADYEAMLERQDKRCAICRNSPKENPRAFTNGGFVVDHDHATSIVRGLLCDLCNKGIGQFRERLDLLTRAAEYISVGISTPLDAGMATVDHGVLLLGNSSPSKQRKRGHPQRENLVLVFDQAEGPSLATS